MLPVAGLLIFLKQYVVKLLAGPSIVPWDEVAESDIDEDEEDDKEKVVHWSKHIQTATYSFLIAGRKEEFKRKAAGHPRGNSKRTKYNRKDSNAPRKPQKVNLIKFCKLDHYKAHLFQHLQLYSTLSVMDSNWTADVRLYCALLYTNKVPAYDVGC